MTISTRVQQQFFAPDSAHRRELIRLPPTVMLQYDALDSLSPDDPIKKAHAPSRSSTVKRRTNLWTVDEHERFLHGLAQYPQGPWKEIAAIVGTKTARQTMTHAQKYRQKIGRRLRGERRHKTLLDMYVAVPYTYPTIVAAPSTLSYGYTNYEAQQQYHQQQYQHQHQPRHELQHQQREPRPEPMQCQSYVPMVHSPVDTSCAVFDAELDDMIFTPQGINDLLYALETGETINL